MKPNWLLVVSFKTELLSEYLIHKGYREDLPKLLPKVGLLQNRMIIDNDIYVDLNEVTEVQRALSEDILTNAQESYQAIEMQSKKLLTISQKAASNIGINISNEELVDRLKTFFNEFQRTLGVIGIPTIIDLTLELIIKKHLEEAKFENIDEAFSTLAVSIKPIATNKEREDLLDIAQAKIEGEDISKLVSKHAEKYGWLYSTLFLGDPYTPYQIGEEVKLVSNPLKEKEQIKTEREKQLKSANKVIDQISSSEGKKIAQFLQQAVYFRTARLEWMNQACFIVRPLINEAARRLGLGLDDVIYLLPNEIYDALFNMRVDNDEIERRQKGYAFVSDDKYECALFIDRELSQWKKKFNKDSDSDIVKGIVACKGKAKGVVVVVKDRSELNKVRSGDILVTPLTTPDFIIAMKKAAAIVTDLGGMTSHAAIVSREIGIPCIVGTRNATKIFQDGDQVEVDAEKGVVTKL
jgi:phosphoenolpyruvate synthase/pyruvate phosphate dikinase